MQPTAFIKLQVSIADACIANLVRIVWLESRGYFQECCNLILLMLSLTKTMLSKTLFLPCFKIWLTVFKNEISAFRFVQKTVFYIS